MDLSLNGAAPPNEQLPEPDLTYYLALRAGYHAAQLAATAWGQALQTLMAAISVQYGFGPEDGLDERGRIRRGAREAAPERQEAPR